VRAYGNSATGTTIISTTNRTIGMNGTSEAPSAAICVKRARVEHRELTPGSKPCDFEKKMGQSFKQF